jgi:Schlafen group 3, DNA/RNA helicase domain
MNRSYYSDTIEIFTLTKAEEIIGKMAILSKFADEVSQKSAWQEEIKILQKVLPKYKGGIYFEYSIPRMGQRIDVLLLIKSVIFILEFKIGETEFPLHAIDQVWDYALDLKNFHETSHEVFIAPILISTEAKISETYISLLASDDKILNPIKCNKDLIGSVIDQILIINQGVDAINKIVWENGRYSPTPTIIEAAMALFAGHSVSEISRSDASAINLSITSDAIAAIIQKSKIEKQKSICFLTGVPGAGKTLVGLNIATTHIDKSSELHSVFLSGNGPLVNILREALARDRVSHGKEIGIKQRKGEALSEVKLFIQNVHNFRDECLKDMDAPPIERVALFDEAQRAWNLEQTANFMRRKKDFPDFNKSEPEFLISCLDRHKDWAVIVCLVGGGQEINTGEAGITEWIESLNRSFSDWHIYISPRLTDSEYSAGEILKNLSNRPNVFYEENLHLSVSMRSFRAEHVSQLIKQILDLQVQEAQKTLAKIKSKYPIAITRDLKKAKEWLKNHARGSERYGIVVSSQAERLKPHSIDVRSPMDPIHWFLDSKKDVRSSYYLESVATEFDIQGLELDWVCVTWDADFRFSDKGWEFRSFVGDHWNHIRKKERQLYLKNAYRVLLTRARQGMVIVVPLGDTDDPTRNSLFYDPVFEYLQIIGFEVLD